jgi:hypothetical protein
LETNQFRGSIRDTCFLSTRKAIFRLFSPDGQLALLKDINEGKQLPVSVKSIAVNEYGAAAISWAQSPFPKGGHAGIDLLDRTGKLVNTIDTGNYLANHIAFGEDHSLWTFGWQRSATDLRKPSSDYMTVRKYSRNGNQVGSYLPRSLFPDGLEPASFGWQERGIQVAHERVGVLACSGMTSQHPEWVELDLNGNLIGRWRVDFSRTVTLTNDGHVYAQHTNSKAHELLLLDRLSSTFEKLDWPVLGTLYGTDVNELVFMDDRNGPIHFSWYGQPSQSR